MNDYGGQGSSLISGSAEVCKMVKTGMFVLLFFVGIAGASDLPPLPQDVQNYIAERKSCNHLGGEDYSDPSRGRAMPQALRECGFGDLNGVPRSTFSVVTVDTIEKRLRTKYRKQPKILQAIDEAND